MTRLWRAQDRAVSPRRREEHPGMRQISGGARAMDVTEEKQRCYREKPG